LTTYRKSNCAQFGLRLYNPYKAWFSLPDVGFIQVQDKFTVFKVNGHCMVHRACMDIHYNQAA